MWHDGRQGPEPVSYTHLDVYKRQQLDLPAGSDRFEVPIPQAEIDANGELTNNDQNPAYK